VPGAGFYSRQAFIAEDMFERRAVIIKSEEPLLEAFMPENITGREGQKQALAEALRPVTLGRKPRNVFLYGPCGTGKTLTARWVLDQLEEHSSARTAYVNCWKKSTTHACLAEILEAIDVFSSYRQANSDLLKALEKEAAEKPVVVCLDEVDTLESPELLYDLSRSGIGMVAVSNDAYALVDIDERVRSSVAPESVEFPAYNDEEIFNILQERKKHALVPGAVKETDLRAIARLARGDARIALETLRRAAVIAEDANSDIVKLDHVKKAFSGTRNLRKTEALKRMNEHEKALYLLLEKEKKPVSTLDLWEKYSSAVKEPCSQRSYRNYMSHLVRLGLASAEGELTGRVYKAEA
jgi:orc1/cdc6 family replication initiation protein